MVFSIILQTEVITIPFVSLQFNFKLKYLFSRESLNLPDKDNEHDTFNKKALFDLISTLCITDRELEK